MGNAPEPPRGLCEWCRDAMAYTHRKVTPNKGLPKNLKVCRGCARKIDDAEMARSIR